MRRFYLVLAVAGCLSGLTWATSFPLATPVLPGPTASTPAEARKQAAADAQAEKLVQAEKPLEAEKPVQAKIVSVALFKNGLAVVKRQVELEGPGGYVLKDAPEPVHGTFQVASAGPIDVQVSQREVPASKPLPLGASLQEELAGLTITVHGRNMKTTITGQVMHPTKEHSEEAPPRGEIYQSFIPPPTEPTSRFLILQTSKGFSYIDFSEIAALEVEGRPERSSRMERKPVLVLTTREAGKQVVQLSSLEHGLSWAPSYRVDLTDARQLRLEQQAVIRNELADFTQADVQLITGYPSIQFAQVTSPLAGTQTWARFFQQLQARGIASSMDNALVMQNIAYQSRATAGPGGEGPVVAPNLGDTIDLHYQAIGQHSLRKGAALQLTTAQGNAEYERIVDWLIPDNRNEWGRPIQRQVQYDPNTGDPLQDDVWDALKFKNPLPFPMTTAPALVITGGNFSGQRQVLWTNQGEMTTPRVNKALSIRARHVEHQPHTNGQPTPDRDIRLCNHRSTPAKLLIKRQFSGTLIQADENPKIDLREEGAWTPNTRNELLWTIPLTPGQEKTIKYRYRALVDF
ncbi:MAG TPA: hypothetical protein PKA06_02910 [Gemmatales bacterium]|mgnify:CR=1 FL=1|nr:hypothetical protein [Gemmatales bacterium]